MKRSYTYIIVIFLSLGFLLPAPAQVPPSKKQKQIPIQKDTTKTITKKGTMTIRKPTYDIGY